MFLKSFVFLCHVYVLYARIIKQDCTVPVSSHYERNLPILLENNTRGHYFNFIIPNGPNVTIKNDDNIYLFCPGVKNYLTKSNASLTTLTCKNGEFFIGNGQIKANEFQCTRLITGSVKLSNKKCANGNGYEIDIGYELINTRQFLPLIMTCYNNRTGTTFYSQHIMYSDAIKFASKSQHRPSFNVAGLGKNISARVAYKRPFQKSILNKLLSNATLAEKYITNSSYLSRGHLAPDSDFIFASWQYTTYYYINSNPQWQQVNGKNWLIVERMVRKHAINYKNRITIYTGSNGILQLKDNKNRAVDIYMLPKKLLPVPKYFWKILHNPITDEGIVFIILNNPFANIEKGDIFCNNICQSYGWEHNKFNLIKNGLLFCCNYVEFAKYVQTVPKLNVTNIMKYVKEIK